MSQSLQATSYQSPTDKDAVAWYCVRTQVKREAVAAAGIRARANADVFAPKISFERKTRVGPKRFTEALFPGYIFVQCARYEQQRLLHAINGVTGFVHFGDYYPRIEDGEIARIRAELGGEHCELTQPALQAGDRVEIVRGPFANLCARVLDVSDSTQRVVVLIDFLGRDLRVDVTADALFKQEDSGCRQHIIPATRTG